MSEQPTGPVTESGEGSQVDALTTVRQASESFLESTNPLNRALQDSIDQGLEAHRKALAQLQDTPLDDQGALFNAVIDYATAVEGHAIEPLRQTLQAIDLPSSVIHAWTEASQPIQQHLASLKDRDRQEISPHIPYLKKMASAVAGLEAGVVNWTRATLAAAENCDPFNDIATSQDTDQAAEAAASEQPAWQYEQLIAAAGDLAERWQRTAGVLRSLHADVAAEANTAASERLKRLEKAWTATPTGDTDEGDLPAEDVDWSNWYQQLDARLTLSVTKWKMLNAIVRLRADFLSGIQTDIIDELRSAEKTVNEELAQNRQQAEEIFDALRDTRNIRNAVRRLNIVLDATTRVFENELEPRLEQMQAMEADGSRAARSLDELRGIANQLPEVLTVHSVPDNNSDEVDATATGRELPVRSAAITALDDILAPTAASWCDDLVERLHSVAEETENLRPVLRFYIGGAVEELLDVSGSRVDPESRQDAEAAANDLTLNGIDRAADTLSSSLQELAQCLDPLSATIHRVTSEYWDSVSSQFSAETTQEKIALQMEASADSAVKAVRLGAIDATRQLSAKLSGQLSSMLARGKTLLRRSQAVIIGEADPVNYETTLTALAEVNNARRRLPPVYRRLFSFHPLTDESLMVGRDKDTTWLRTHYVARRRGRTNAVVLTGTPGCGVTTFIDAAKRSYLRRTDFRIVDLPGRITDEAVLVGTLRKTLGLSELTDDNMTLVSVADEIMSTEGAGPTRVCVVDRLEHLFLRKIGGFKLAARMLRFMSETGPRIFWIATASDFAWQLLLKNEPLTQGLVSHYRLSEYDRNDIEEIINQRHRRSALTLSFDSPVEFSPLERRRLRKAETEEEKQAIYREAYFDDFFAASGQNVMLALFYWLLSVRYVSEPPAIEVVRLPDLKFELLARLSVPEMFALKAFLEHATLTLDEYIDISSMDDHSALEVFESLGNAMIIELARGEDSGLMDLEFERIERNGRYRLRPLLVQPVIRSLRETNIVH